jgi:hypothetical protein
MLALGAVVPLLLQQQARADDGECRRRRVSQILRSWAQDCRISSVQDHRRQLSGWGESS